MDPYEEYMEALEQAHIHAQKALQALYKPGAPKRGIYTRILLGKAQSALISLYVIELRQKKNETQTRERQNVDRYG